MPVGEVIDERDQFRLLLRVPAEVIVKLNPPAPAFPTVGLLLQLPYVIVEEPASLERRDPNCFLGRPG